jgi:hypothetical protein
MRKPKKSSGAFLILLTLGVAAVLFPDHLTAKSKLESMKNRAFTDRTDYFSCRKKVLKKFDTQLINQSVSQHLLNQCRDQYPGAAKYIDCRKKRSREWRHDRARLVAAMVQCKEEYKKYSFDPKQDIPIFTTEAAIYFAGAGLNLNKKLELPPKKPDDEKIPLAELQLNDFGNFSCANLTDSIVTQKPYEYLLIGNHPNAFSGFSSLSHAEMLKKLKISRKQSQLPGDQPALVKNVGAVYNKNDAAKISLYFPVSSCFFENRLGGNYEAIKIYYLVDQPRKTLTPYFGVAFYDRESSLALSTAITKTIQVLGPQYASYPVREGITIIAREQIQQFDDEGDPFNLCQGSRPHDYIAILKEKAAKPGTVEFLMLASIKNLCNFGDAISKRLK